MYFPTPFLLLSFLVWILIASPRQTKFFYPYGYNSKMTKLAAHADTSPFKLLQKEYPQLVKQCETWAAVADPTLKFKVEIVNDSNWPSDEKEWTDNWLADLTADKDTEEGDEDDDDDESEDDF